MKWFYRVFVSVGLALVACNPQRDELSDVSSQSLQNKLTITEDSIHQPPSVKKEKQGGNEIPIKLFKQWEKKLLEKGIFDYVTQRECGDIDKMMELYEAGKYPMHVQDISGVSFDYNGDGLNDYLINYVLTNCVRGNGWSTDFIFFISNNGRLQINEALTNKLKRKISNYVKTNFGSDTYLEEVNNYIIAKTFKIVEIKNTICLGEFDLKQDGATCCPELSGEFKYNIQQDKFEVLHLKKNAQ